MKHELAGGVRRSNWPHNQVGHLITNSDIVITMNVSLTPELERLVTAKVRTGLYGSASEVVREALRLLKERDRVQSARIEQLRREIDIGLEQLGGGRTVQFDPADLKRRIRA